MSEYWRRFFDRYVREAGDDPYRQVGRTLNSESMGDRMFSQMAARLIEHLELRPDHRVLDFCCGNGLLGAELAGHCKQVVGVDFSKDLVAATRERLQPKISGLVADATAVAFRPAAFDRIVFAAAVQHFTPSEVIGLFERLALWLKPGGLLLLADVLDAARIWNYYDSEERESVYFRHTLEGTPVLGSWFDRLWLEKLGRHAGFERVRVLEQAEDYWYSHYRFDLLLYR